MMRPSTASVGGSLHHVEIPGDPGGPTFVCLHALEGHHANWLGLAPLLAERGRVLVPDMVGFGLTPLDGRRATIGENQRHLNRFLWENTDGPVVLVGNSMGSALALLQARAQPGRIAGLVLIGPAIARSIRHGIDPIVVPIFGGALVPNRVASFFGRRLEPRGPEWFVRQMLLLCTRDPARVPEDLVAANVAVASERLRMPWAPIAFSQAARSTMLLLASARRFWNMMSGVATPTLLLAGRYDRLVPLPAVEAAARARPDWDLTVLDAGHMPQLEDARGTADAILSWLDARLAS